MGEKMFTMVTLVGTTDGNGDAIVTSTRAVNGLFYGLIEDKGTLSDGVDLTLASVQGETAITLLTLTNANTDQAEYYPRASSCGNTGTSNSDSMIMQPVVGHLRLTIAQGGATHTGGVYAFVLE